MAQLLKSLREKRSDPGKDLPSGYQKKTLPSMIIDELDAIGSHDYSIYELLRAGPDDVRLSVMGIRNDQQFREGLDADVLTDDMIPLTSALAAQDFGDAREAIERENGDSSLHQDALGLYPDGERTDVADRAPSNSTD